VRHYSLNPHGRAVAHNHTTTGYKLKTGCGCEVDESTIVTDVVTLVECPACVACVIAGMLKGQARLGPDWRCV
jgi:hypothetical protein